jgi:hypothetical protein
MMIDSGENRGVEETALRAYVNLVPDPSPDQLANLRRDVLTRIAADTAPARRRIWTGNRAISIGAAGVLVLGVATAAGVAHLPSGKDPGGLVVGLAPGSASPAYPSDPAAVAMINATSAQETLTLLANHTSLAGATATVEKNSFLYTREHELLLLTAIGADGPAAYTYEVVTDIWTSADELRDVRITGTRGLNGHGLTPADEVKLREYGVEFDKVVRFESPPGPTDDRKPGMGNPTPAYLASLPTDPEKLLKVLRAEGDGNTELTNSLIFKTIPSLATRTDAVISPQLRSAFVRVLALLPDVQRVPGQVSILGRTGVAIAETHDDIRHEIIFDPETARIIGYAVVAVRDMTYSDNVQVPEGTILDAKICEQTVVTKVGATTP